YTNMQRYEDAERAARRALTLEESRSALNNLGAALVYQGKDHDALGFYERARSIGPENIPLLLNLGDSYRRINQPRQAEEAYRRGRDLVDQALRANPAHALNKAYYGYFCLRLGDRTSAERETAQSLQLQPEAGPVIRRAVITYEALGQRDKAITLLQGAP